MVALTVQCTSLQKEVLPQAGTAVQGTNPLAMLPTTAQTALYLELHAEGLFCKRVIRTSHHLYA